MPYVITTSSPMSPDEPDGFVNVSRIAVATLEEAWDKLPPGIPDTTLVRERFDLETVGSCQFGPLPDGTVIEVRPVDWPTITGPLPDTVNRESVTAVLRAFNAQHA